MLLNKIDCQLDDFMNYCQEKNLSIKTLTSYEQTLRLFVRYLYDTYKVIDVKDVKEDMIRNYIRYLQERGKYTITADEKTKMINFPDNREDYGKKLSTGTINNYLRNIKVFFNFLVEFGEIRTNPAKKIKPLKQERKQIEFIDDEDLLKLLRYMDTTKFHEYRDYIIIQLLFDTGMRVGECLAIQMDDIDFIGRAIRLEAENTKGKKERYVFYSQHMSQELRRWIDYKDRYVESDYLFCTKRGNPLRVEYFEKNFRQYGERVGLDVHPHMLRHNFAKRCLMAGMDIYTLSRILGHSSVTTTEKTYLQLINKDDLRKNYAKYSPLTRLKKRW